MLRLARSIACALVATLVTATALVAGVVSPAAAADPSAFRPSSIISDALFFDGGAMTAGDVQAFLVSKGGSCTAGGLCLKNYAAATTSQPAEANLCNAYDGGGVESAATIIAKVGAACGVSQKALLVTLQKEQGLVTATAPTDSRYRIAMGFGCPDTAPCDSQYYGFFNQVYKAARQFKRYAANPQNYSYRAGRVNTILFHPSGAAACGSSQVFIDNQATAGLYTYTPYQPNASALANLYGTGDGCGSYGNRNFWRDYTDWFGSTQVGASLVRTAESTTVYLVTFDHKYPIADLATMQGLAPLGAVGYVQQSFLDSRTTGVTLGRFLRDRQGYIYFIDRGQLFSVTDCNQLADWGASCADYGTMALSDVQMAGFQRMRPLSSSVRTVEGKWFAVYGGAKHEVADAWSASLSGPASATPITVAGAALDQLPYGAPIIRAGAVLRDRDTWADVLVDDSGFVPVAAGLVGTTALRNLGVLPLDHSSMVQLRGSVQPTLTGTFRSRAGQLFALSTGAPIALGAGQLPQLAATAPTLAPGVMAALGTPTSGTVFVRAIDNGTLYLATDSAKRGVATMEIAASVAWPAGVNVAYVSAGDLAKIPTGVDVLRPGSMVKSPDSPVIYVVDGLRSIVGVTSFAITEPLGISGWTTVPAATLAGYKASSAPLTGLLGCGPERYVGVGGRIVRVSTGVVDASGAPRTTFEPMTCATLKIGAPSNASALFVKSPEQDMLYVASAGKKRPIATMATASAIAGGGEMVIAQIPQVVLDTMATGVQAMSPGSLIKTPDDPMVYVVDGLTTVIPLSSYSISEALGISSSVSVVSPAVLGGYTKAELPINTVITCGSVRAIGYLGRLNVVSTSVFDASGVPRTSLDPSTCAALPRSAAAPSSAPIFVRTLWDPTFYMVSGGQKFPVATMDRVFELTAGQPLYVGIVNQSQLSALPTDGPA